MRGNQSRNLCICFSGIIRITFALLTQGTVDFVDDTGTIHVDWDNGSTLGLVPGEDQYRFVDE
jgi:hypothetical protein